MVGDLLSERAAAYNPSNAVEQELVLAELLQQMALSSLAKSKFFSKACFHGGTYLRIMHGLNRFSENLDFMLLDGAEEFSWQPYLDSLLVDLSEYGIEAEAADRSKATSIGTILKVTLPFARQKGRKIKIKLEIDTNPPEGSKFEIHYINFPTLVAINTQTLSSSFASKTHALLCRKYTKSRDWYDFLWYVGRKIEPDLPLLENALRQVGPWAGKSIVVTGDWLFNALESKVKSIDWAVARKDVERFILNDERPSIELWNEDLFFYHLKKMSDWAG